MHHHVFDIARPLVFAVVVTQMRIIYAIIIVDASYFHHPLPYALLNLANRS